MGALGSFPIEQIIRTGSIKDVDVLRLRSALHGDGIATAEEAELLFGLNEGCPSQHPAWADLFIETLTDYLVDQSEPEGYLTTDDARRLIERVTRKGRCPRKVELDLIVNILDASRWSPVSLSRFALEQVRRAVTHGDGPLRTGHEPVAGSIREPEVELVRRILYAFGGDGSLAVTRAEAEVLFDINDAIADPAANPAWADLFVKAITNVVMAASGRAVPTREEALRRDAVWGAYQEQSPEERALARLEHQRIEIITNEAITEAETGWLCERIGRGARLTANEAALVAYLKQESRAMHPDLRAAVERLAEAA